MAPAIHNNYLWHLHYESLKSHALHMYMHWKIILYLHLWQWSSASQPCWLILWYCIVSLSQILRDLLHSEPPVKVRTFWLGRGQDLLTGERSPPNNLASHPKRSTRSLHHSRNIIWLRHCLSAQCIKQSWTNVMQQFREWHVRPHLFHCFPGPPKHNFYRWNTGICNIIISLNSSVPVT